MNSLRKFGGKKRVPYAPASGRLPTHRPAVERDHPQPIAPKRNEVLPGLGRSAAMFALLASVMLGLGVLFMFGFDNPIKTKWGKARAEIGELQKALNLYASDNNGAYPEDLEAIADKLPGGKVPNDPFSKEAYQYEVTEDGFTITCLGKDQAEGGEAAPEKDIVCNQWGFVDE